MFCNFHSDLFPSINNCITELGNILMDKCTHIYIFVHGCLHSLCNMQNHHTDMYSSAIVCWHTFWSFKNCGPVEPSCFSYHSLSANWKESMKWRAETESCFSLQVLISWMISILLSWGGAGAWFHSIGTFLETVATQSDQRWLGVRNFCLIFWLGQFVFPPRLLVKIPPILVHTLAAHIKHLVLITCGELPSAGTEL